MRKLVKLHDIGLLNVLFVLTVAMLYRLLVPSQHYPSDPLAASLLTARLDDYGHNGTADVKTTKSNLNVVLPDEAIPEETPVSYVLGNAIPASESRVTVNVDELSTEGLFFSWNDCVLQRVSDALGWSPQQLNDVNDALKGFVNLLKGREVDIAKLRNEQNGQSLEIPMDIQFVERELQNLSRTVAAAVGDDSNAVVEIFRRTPPIQALYTERLISVSETPGGFEIEVRSRGNADKWSTGNYLFARNGDALIEERSIHRFSHLVDLGRTRDTFEDSE